MYMVVFVQFDHRTSIQLENLRAKVSNSWRPKHHTSNMPALSESPTSGPELSFSQSRDQARQMRCCILETKSTATLANDWKQRNPSLCTLHWIFHPIDCNSAEESVRESSQLTEIVQKLRENYKDPIALLVVVCAS